GVASALAQFLGQIGQHGLTGAGKHNGRALSVQSAGDSAADAAGRASDEGGLAGKVEHQAAPFRDLAKASRSSGVFRATASASGAMRLAMPVRTLPEPISAKRVTPPSVAIQVMLSRQRTRPVTCSTSRRRMA